MGDSELLSIFWDEVGEYLEVLNNGLLQIEMIDAKDLQARHDLLREMNRVAHSMKGAARAVGIGVIETIGHYMEEVFGAIQKDTMTLSPDVADTLYDALDLVTNVTQGDENDDETVQEILTNLERLIILAPPADTTHDSHEMEVVEIASADEDDLVDDDEIDDVVVEEVFRMRDEAVPMRETGMFQVTIDPASSSKPMSARYEPPPELQTLNGGFTTTDMSTLVMRPAEETVRITVSKLDRLMEEATELLIARMHGEEQQRNIKETRRLINRWQKEWRGVRAAYIRTVRRLQDEGAHNSELPILLKFLEFNQRMLTETARQLQLLSQSTIQNNTHLNTLSEQLQDDISGMRMMPFETIIGGFQRMMRDLARDTRKQLQLDIEGAAVEIDKSVLEQLKDPLMHLLRNAIDHGIESPEDRQLHGKSPIGHIKIEVEQRGSEIIVRVIDDGRGINPDSVRKVVVERGIMSESDALALSDEDARMYIFQSGLSTLDKVTSLSGRGIGMDIVRDRVESLRGRVSLHSVVGQGTTTTLSVPVSLTRIRCVLLRVGEQHLAVPSAMVIRMGEFSRDEVFTAEGREMVLINERPTPLASLGQVLNVPSANADELVNIITLQATDRLVAFEVDELQTEQELVLKPLGPELARAPYVAGAALLGTGDVIIVLDANDLIRKATGAAIPRRRAYITDTSEVATRRLRVLVVDDSITTRTLEKNILETAGFEVHVAFDGVEAWHTLSEYDFDLVISDVEMPNMTGLELAAKIKSSGQYRHIPVILLTSLSKPEQREAGLRAGADAYLVKSRFDQGELLATIQSVV
ncbi:MAG: hybrid sensor histidine kinase/response regulator [Aggregatilineales bacterium]